MATNSSPIQAAKVTIRRASPTRVALAVLWIIIVAVLVFGAGRIPLIRDNAALLVFLAGSVVPPAVWWFTERRLRELAVGRQAWPRIKSEPGAPRIDGDEQTEHDPFGPEARSQNASSVSRDDRTNMPHNPFDFTDARPPERTSSQQPPGSYGMHDVLRPARSNDHSAPRATVDPASLTVSRRVPLGSETASVQSEMTDIGVPTESTKADRDGTSTTRGKAVDRLFGRSADRIDTEESTVDRILSFPGGGSALYFDADSATDTGPRKENQDWAILSGSLLGIADGVGGRSAGGQASRAALRSVRDAIEEDGLSLASAVTRANTDVRARQDDDPADRGRATTLDVVHLDETGSLYGAHVGDSRVYILPARGRRLRRMTADHSTGNTLTRSIGGAQSVTPDVWAHEAEAGDIVLVATDGLWKGSLHERDIEAILVEARQRSTVHIAERLVEIAKSGATDNITVIVGRIQRA